MTGRLTAIALAAAALAAPGCISSTRYGTDQITTLASGATEAQVIRQHGAPDNIIYLGTPWVDPRTGARQEVDKYLFEYRIGGGQTVMGDMYASDEFHNICYLIQDGKVLSNGNFVDEGKGTIIGGLDLGVWNTPFGTLDLRFGGYVHPKARAGYGGAGTPEGPDADTGR